MAGVLLLGASLCIAQESEPTTAPQTGAPSAAQIDAKIKELEEQLRALREAKDNLEQQQTELREMMAKLEEDKTMADAEREKIVEEVRMKQEEIDKIKSEVDEKERIAKELQVL